VSSLATDTLKKNAGLF